MYLEVTISLRQDLLYISQDESKILEIFQVALLHKLVECYRRKDQMVIRHISHWAIPNFNHCQNI